MLRKKLLILGGCCSVVICSLCAQHDFESNFKSSAKKNSTMIEYRNVYESKMRNPSGNTVFLDEAGKPVTVVFDGLPNKPYVVQRTDNVDNQVSKVHNQNYFLIGNREATIKEVEAIGDFLYNKKILLVQGDEYINACWNYYKYCICKFLYDRADAAISEAETMKKSLKEETEALDKKVKEANKLIDSYNSQADHFNIKVDAEFRKVDAKIIRSSYSQSAKQSLTPRQSSMDQDNKK